MVINDDVFNAQEAADFLGAHVETVRRMARKGDIPSYKLGKDWRFRKDALLKWAETDHLQRKPPLVLVIGSDAGTRKLVKHHLEGEGYRVCSASDDAEGLRWLNKESVNLIVLDLKVLEMSGLTFLRELREAHGMLPVIVMTQYPDGPFMADAIQYGPLTLLAKPVEKKQLIQGVETILNGALKAQTGQ